MSDYQIEYTSRNSGETWFLDDREWEALARAGWDVEASANKAQITISASSAREALTDAIHAWERVTGCQASNPGCDCCGPPHNFSTFSDGSLEYASGDGVAELLTGLEDLSYREALEQLRSMQEMQEMLDGQEDPKS